MRASTFNDFLIEAANIIGLPVTEVAVQRLGVNLMEKKIQDVEMEAKAREEKLEMEAKAREEKLEAKLQAANMELMIFKGYVSHRGLLGGFNIKVALIVFV
jgi:hypothetical protein